MSQAAASPQNQDEANALSSDELRSLVRSQADTIASLRHQLDWFKRQIFDTKSERYAPEPDPKQMYLGELPAPAAPASEPRKEIPAHTRRAAKRDIENDAEALPFFDASRVPVQTILLTDRGTAGLSSDQFEVIGEKVSFRLAQRRGSYVVLKYVRPVTKRRDTQTIHALLADLWRA